MNVHSTGVAVLAVSLLLLLTGCAGFVGSEEIEATAQPAEIDTATTERTGYEFDGRENRTLDTEVSLLGETRTITANTNTAVYSYTPEDPRELSFSKVALWATPNFEVAGQQLNPVARLSNDELIDAVMSRTGLGGANDVEEVDSNTILVNGGEQEVSIYRGVMEQQGQQVAVNIYITTVEFDDSTVLAFGFAPENAGDSESERVFDAFTGIQLAE